MGTGATRLLPCLIAITAASAGAIGAATVTADFGAAGGYPLDKSKINLYTTAIPSTQAFERDIPWLAHLRPEVLRLEFFWGMNQTLSRTVGGTAAAPVYDWALIDHWQKLVRDQGSLVQWGYGYTPFPLGNGQPNAFKNPPPAEPWKRIVGDVAAHLKGKDVAYHEVWNEPNFDWFFTGGPQDYFAIYANTARAIKAADADAKVGGPAVSLPDWYQSFADFVKAQDLPLDFFSFHNYGEHAHDWITLASGILAKDARWQRTEAHLDEYNVYHSWPAGGPQDRFEGANDMLDAFLGFCARPELASIAWAQFMDPCDCGGLERLGLLDLNGRRKATYNAFRIWAMIPVDRNDAKSDVAGLKAAASSDAHRAGVLILNRSGSDQNVTVRFRNPPFARGTVRVYPIDKAHNSRGDGANEDLTPSQTLEDVALSDWAWTGTIPRMGTLYLEAGDGSPAARPRDNPVSRILSVNHWYPERGKTPSYAAFDRRTWTARLGMMGAAAADQEIGVTAEGLPPALGFRIRAEGLAKRDANSLLGLRVDFQTPAGYGKGVLFHGPVGSGPGLYDPARSAPMPYGTRRAADQVVAVPDFGRFTVELARYAPPGWTGRTQLLFILKNAGPEARVIAEVEAAAGTGAFLIRPKGTERATARRLMSGPGASWLDANGKRRSGIPPAVGFFAGP